MFAIDQQPQSASIRGAAVAVANGGNVITAVSVSLPTSDATVLATQVRQCKLDAESLGLDLEISDTGGYVHARFSRPVAPEDDSSRRGRFPLRLISPEGAQRRAHVGWAARLLRRPNVS